MKIRVLLLAMFFVAGAALAQPQGDCCQSMENPSDGLATLLPENVLGDFLCYDFSLLLLPQSDFLGFIGDDFQRIKVFFHSIVQDVDDPTRYSVTGASVVHNNRCDFKGALVISEIRKLKEMHFGIGEMYKDSGIVAQGLALGKYLFRENPDQNHVGIFEGRVALWWYLDGNNVLHFDNINSSADSFCNNQYLGTWTEYGAAWEPKVCNWGEFRICSSRDLDVGTRKFFPNKKYKKAGWESFF